MFTILIIDDDPVVQLILKKVLQEQGYSVVVAQRGEEGIEQAQQLRPALIICDWEMSGISGLEVCHFIKTHPNLSSTFFILLTARSAIADRVKGLDTGADDFLLKPIEGSELRARVKSGLRLYQANQELQKLADNLQAQQRLLEAELAEASNYLRSLLPNPIIGNVAIDFRFLPSRQLGGDCFDYYWLDSDYLMIYLLDVSGHGLRAALPSVSIQNLLRTQSLQAANFYEPSSVLEALNDVLQMEDHEDQYFTIWYGVYNQKKRQLFYASAGHPPAVLISQNEAKLPQVRKLKTRGCAIGMFPDTKYVSERCEVDASSTLYIFSDGIYEILQANGTIVGLEKFIEILTNYTFSNNDDLSVLLQQMMYLNQNHAFEDDCSLLQIKLA